MDEAQIFGLIGFLLLLAFTAPLRSRRSGRIRHPRTDTPYADASQDEHRRTQDFLESLIAENRRLMAENRTLRQRLDGEDRATPPLSPTERAMIDLGLDPRQQITRRGLRRAYVARVKVAHPDQGGSAEELARILRAHDLLLEALARKRPG